MFFGGYKDEIWKTVLATVEQYEKLKMDEWSAEDQGRWVVDAVTAPIPILTSPLTFPQHGLHV